MAVTLKTQRPELTVNIGGEREVGVPLTFTRQEYEEFGKAESKDGSMFAFFRKYLGDVVDEIGDDDITALFSAWMDARNELGEPALGESKASPTR